MRPEPNKNDDTSQVCLGRDIYPPSCCIWRKPKLSLQRLWMLRMLRMLHWLHRLQLHRWLMNGWCMLQWLWHWLHWLGHWLRHRLPSMNLSRCCLIARVDGTQIKRNNLGGLVWFGAKTQNGFKIWAAGIKTNSMVLKLMPSNTLSRFKNDSTALSLPVDGDLKSLKLIEAQYYYIQTSNVIFLSTKSSQRSQTTKGIRSTKYQLPHFPRAGPNPRWV